MTIKILKKFTLFLLFTISILGVINADEAIETNNQSRTINTFSIEEIIVTAEKGVKVFRMFLNLLLH